MTLNIFFANVKLMITCIYQFLCGYFNVQNFAHIKCFKGSWGECRVIILPCYAISFTLLVLNLYCSISSKSLSKPSSSLSSLSKDSEPGNWLQHYAGMNTPFSSTQMIKSRIKQFSQEQTFIFACNQPSELKHFMYNDLQPLIFTDFFWLWHTSILFLSTRNSFLVSNFFQSKLLFEVGSLPHRQSWHQQGLCCVPKYHNIQSLFSTLFTKEYQKKRILRFVLSCTIIRFEPDYIK